MALRIRQLIDALRYYAHGKHFDKSGDEHSWDTVSGEPQNFWCDEAGTATVEDGSIAALALRGTPLTVGRINGADHNASPLLYDEPPILGEAPLPLTFEELHAISYQRALRWHPGGLDEWNIAEWSNAMAGEAGEACNATKKLRRIECKMQQADGDTVAPKTLAEARAKVAKEVGDTVIYADLLARQAGFTLEECVRMAFNQISEREGFPERI